MKCDEEKPFCNRCTSTGRACDGYDVNFRPPSNSPKNSPPPNQDLLRPGRELVRSVSPVPLAPALCLKTPQEHASFEFFTTHAVFSLRGFLDSPFWQRELLQGAYQHESIQHCIVALGAMHRRFHEGNSSHIHESEMTDQYLQFALRQSNQAIQGLLKSTGPVGRMAGVDKVTLMTCSVLFSSMACLQGHQREGLQHLRSGIRLLNELDHGEKHKCARHPIDVDSLRSILIGLDMQARCIMTTEDSREWEPIPLVKEPKISRHAYLNDDSLVAMHRNLQAQMNHVLAFLQRHLTQSMQPTEDIDAVYHEYRRLLTRFDRTTELLEDLCAKAARGRCEEFTQPVMALQLLHTELEYFLRVPRGDLEDKFQSFLGKPVSKPSDVAALFTRMLDLATQLLPHNSSLSPVFTTSMGPCAALWLIASRAPSSCQAIRKRAVRVMLSYPRREGFWDGLVAGQIAQELLRLEQESTQEELGLMTSPNRDLIVPNDLRIVVVKLKYDQVDNRRATVEFRSARDMATDTPGKTHFLSW